VTVIDPDGGVVVGGAGVDLPHAAGAIHARHTAVVNNPGDRVTFGTSA